MRKRLSLFYGLITLILIAGCTSNVRYTRSSSRPSSVAAKREKHKTLLKPKRHALRGIASYYGPGFHGKLTANGEKFNMYAMTAAHKTLPFNTKVKVKNLDNDRTVIIRINDRGPFKKGRIIDLSKGAAKKAGMLKTGTANVKLEILK